MAAEEAATRARSAEDRGLSGAPERRSPGVEVSIIVPVQSVDAEIEEVVDALGGQLTADGRTWEAILVFDGVRGKAFETAMRVRERLGDKLKTITFKNHFGESVCLSAGCERAGGKYIVTSPQYVQVDPAELRSMLAKLDEGADFVTPWRKARVDPLLNRLQSAIFSAMFW